MKLLNLKLTGFIGIAKGLGVEEIDLELSSLNGLIALEGDNGKGKTTLLENMQPFRTLPSRKSTLKRHCYLKNSQKELSFAFNGSTYRTLVKMDPTTTIGDEGYIWKDGESVVDGKVSNFDKYLVELLGSQNLFFNSIFCAQNSAKLSDMRPAELKALFAEFLRLDRYVAWEDTAKAAARIYSQAIGQAYNEAERIDTSMKMIGDPRADLEKATTIHTRIEGEIKELTHRIHNNTEDLVNLKKIVLASHINKEKVAALTKERDRLRAHFNELSEAQDKLNTDFMIKSAAIEDEAREVEKIIEGKDEIQGAIETIKAADNILGEIEVKLEKLETQAKGYNSGYLRVIKLTQDKKQEGELYRQDPSIKDEIITMEQNTEKLELLHIKASNISSHPDLIGKESAIRAMEKSAAVLDDIAPSCPCPPEVCGLITKSLDDKKDLPTVRRKYEETKTKIIDGMNMETKLLDDLILQSDNRIKKLTTDHANIVAGIEAELKELNQQSDSIEADLDFTLTEIGNLKITRKKWMDRKEAATPMADKAAEILVAESRFKTLNKEIEKIAMDSEEATRKYLAESKQHSADLLANQEAIDAAEKLVDLNAETDLQLTENAINNDTLDKQSLDADIGKYSQVIENCLKEISSIKAMEKDLADIEAKINSYNSQQSDWNYLKDACSKDGLRALEIEGVAPVITGYANDMLTGTFGPNYSVRFETQDEDGREVLDIVVIGEGGSETLLSNLSGGERVWILKAMRLAQTLISQQKSGRHFQTALMDEEDGALSNDNAMRFISLYGTLMKMADMDSCYFISHRPDAINMADHRIRFEEGRITVI